MIEDTFMLDHTFNSYTNVSNCSKRVDGRNDALLELNWLSQKIGRTIGEQYDIDIVSWKLIE